MREDLSIVDFAEAISPKTFDICGWVLKPFCLGHYILLRKINSPLVNLNGNKDFHLKELETMTKEQLVAIFSDFFTAILICSLDYPLALKAMNNEPLMKQISDKFTKQVMDNMKKPKWNYFREFYVFKAYISYYFNIPPFDPTNRNTGKEPSGSDWVQNIYIIFKKLGYSELEIMCMPLNKIFMEWTSEAEANGAGKILNSFELHASKNPGKINITTTEGK